MSERIKWIDCAKGIAAALVLIGHFVPVRLLQIFIYSFHMPLFFFLAGVTFKNQQVGLGTFINRKFKQIMVPYFIFVIPMFVMKCLQDIGDKNVKLLIKQFIGIFFCWKGTALYSGVWFLPCMFVVYILAWGGGQLQSIAQRMFATIIAATIGFVLAEFNLTLPFGADTALVAVAFFESGTMLKKYEKIVDEKYMAAYIVITLTLSILNFKLCGQRIEMYSCDYGNMLLFVIASFSGIMGTVTLAKKLADNRLLEKMGKSAMYLYGAQLVPFSIYSRMYIAGSVTKVVIGMLTVIIIGSILLLIKPLYDKLVVKCCHSLKLD